MIFTKYKQLLLFYTSLLSLLLIASFHTIQGMDEQQKTKKSLKNVAITTFTWINPICLTYKAVNFISKNIPISQNELDKRLFNAMDYDTKIKYNINNLLEQKANPNKKHFYGNTVLHNAIDNFELMHIPLLIKHGADASLQNNDGNTIFHLALMRHSIKDFEQLCLIKKARTPLEDKQVLTFLLILKRMQKKTNIIIPKVLRKYIFIEFLQIPFADTKETTIAKKSILEIKNNKNKTALELYEECKKRMKSVTLEQSDDLDLFLSLDS